MNFPDHLPNPVSVAQISGKQVDLQHALFSIVNKVCHLLLNSTFSNRYYFNKMYRLGEWHYFENMKGDVFQAKILGTDNNGLLILEKAEGQEEKFNFHEIRFIINNKEH